MTIDTQKGLLRLLLLCDLLRRDRIANRRRARKHCYLILVLSILISYVVCRSTTVQAHLYQIFNWEGSVRVALFGEELLLYSSVLIAVLYCCTRVLVLVYLYNLCTGSRPTAVVVETPIDAMIGMIFCSVTVAVALLWYTMTAWGILKCCRHHQK